MGLFDLLHIFVFALYLGGTVCIFFGTLASKESVKRLGQSAAVAGFSLHTADLAALLILGRTAAFSQATFYFSLFSWSLLLIYFVLWLKFKLPFLALTAAPLALLLFSSSFAFSGLKVIIPKTASGLFFGLHVGALYISMGLLAMAFGAGIAFIFLERKIKTKSKLAGLGKDLPSLSAFDKANHLAVVAGFPFYTLGLLSGFIWAGLDKGKLLTGHPREITSLLTWLLFAFLFHQRVALGWQGRKPARIAIWVFAFTIVSMLAIHWLFPVHHSLSQLK